MTDFVTRAAELLCAVIKDQTESIRAELAGAAAQRDAHLSRSVELAARVTELEAQLAAATPAVDEVDDFRVGDLVMYGGKARAITEIVRGTHPVAYMSGRPEVVDRLTRKPVEVGDTVRGVAGGGVVRAIAKDGFASVINANAAASNFSAHASHLVAIAPTVKL